MLSFSNLDIYMYIYTPKIIVRNMKILNVNVNRFTVYKYIIKNITPIVNWNETELLSDYTYMTRPE